MKIKLSTNVILQIAAILAAFCSTVLDVVPPEYKTIVILVSALAAAIISVLGHNSNPDGTPVTTAYVKKSTGTGIGGSITPIIMIVGILVLLPAVSSAQELDGRIGVAGFYYSNDVPGSIGGFGALSSPLTEDGKTRNFTGFKLFSADPEGPGNVILAGQKLRYNIFTGFSRQLIKFGDFTVHAMGTGGFETDGEQSSGTADLGGFGHFAISDRCGVMVIGAAEYSGIESAWIINPAVGFSFKF
jgi:hypothetical protein